jgi:hypothetical protein
MRRIETVALGFAAAALVAASVLLAQEPPAPAQAPPEVSAPPAATAPEAAPPPAPAADEPAPAPGGASDDEFVPSQELNADDQVTFPVDI